MRLSINAIKMPAFIFFILVVILFIHSANYDFSFKLSVHEYLYTSWLFNYDYGFMRRALPGELLSLLNFENDYKTVRAISAVIFFILFSLFSLFLIKSLDKIKVENVYLYSACILFLSFSTSQWLLELGRFDQFIQIFQLIFLVVILKSRNLIISFFSLLVFIVLSALIHEAALIIFIPTLLLIFFIEFKNKAITLLLSAILIVAIVLMIKFGQISVWQSNQILEIYKDNRSLDQYAVRTTILGLWDNVLSSYYSFFDHKTYIPLLLSLVFLYPVWSFIRHVFYKKVYLLLLLPTLTPLGLSFIAFDYYRWIALALFNITVLLFYLINTEKVNLSVIREYFIKNKRNFIVYAAICLLLGPLGVVRVFPNFYNVNYGGFSSGNLPNEVLLKLNLAAPTDRQIFAAHTDSVGWEIETDLIHYQNVKKAMKWYEVASDQGDVNARNNLALMYTRGGPINMDYHKALVLLKSASKANNAYATNNLGVMYSNGFGVDANGKQALSFYFKAAEQGNPAAMYNIGMSYLDGLNGLERDKLKAKPWFKKAAALGFGPAVERVK